MIKSRHMKIIKSGSLVKYAAKASSSKLVIFILVFATVGSITLIATRAASPSVSIEPEKSSSIAAPAALGSDTSASNGAYVQFKKAGSDPCLATLGVPNMPCAANTGVPASYLASQGLASASQLPLYDMSTPRPCGTVITGKRITSGLDINYGNNTHDSSIPCLTITDSLITISGSPGAAAISVPYLGSGSCSASTKLCGPVVITDSEVVVNGCSGCSGGAGGAGGSMGLDGPNIHATRVNVHGMSTQMFNNAAYDELKDSYVHGMTNIAGDNHMAAVAINTGSTGQYVTIDHNTLSCDSAVTMPGAQGGCSAVANIYIQRSDSHDITFNNNYFWQADGVKGGAGVYSLYFGITNCEAGNDENNTPACGKHQAYNITWSNNWMDALTWPYDATGTGCNGSPCRGGPVYTSYNPSYGVAHGDLVCGNKYRPSDQNVTHQLVANSGISNGVQWIADEFPTGGTLNGEALQNVSTCPSP